MRKTRYNHLNDYYKKIFGERTLKIAVDGGFTCPNRDGSKGIGGCIFCSSRGSGDRLASSSVKEQVEAYFSSFKAKKANKFIVYFQNYTNTYKSVDELKQIYDSALIDERIIGLDIATRSDCLDEEKVKLLASYQDKLYVQVELGFQTSNDKTKEFCNQKTTNDDFIKTVSLLNKYNIPVVVHIMVGLPNESHQEIEKTVQFLNKINYQGIKIHSTFIEKDTGLYELYKQTKYSPISYEEYMEELVYIITHINKDVVVHRITGDPYLPNFVAPEWMSHKKKVINHIESILEERDLYQGIFYK